MSGPKVYEHDKGGFITQDDWPNVCIRNEEDWGFGIRLVQEELWD